MSTDSDDLAELESDGDEPRTYTDWDIRNEGRPWERGEARERYDRTPEKIEMIEGQLFWSDEERLTMLGLLLELVGADQAVRLGDPEVWRRAVAKLNAEAGSS